MSCVCCRTVARKFSIGGFCVCAGGLDIIKFTKNPLIYSFYVPILGCLELCLGGCAHQSPTVATGLVCCRLKWLRLFWKSHKRGLHVYYGEEKSQNRTHFDSQTHSSHNENNGVETSVPKLCVFFRIFIDLLCLLTNQNFWGRLVPPCIPASYTTVETGLEIKYRDSITAVHGIKYRNPTKSLKMSMQYSC